MPINGYIFVKITLKLIPIPDGITTENFKGWTNEILRPDNITKENFTFRVD